MTGSALPYLNIKGKDSQMMLTRVSSGKFLGPMVHLPSKARAVPGLERDSLRRQR